MPAHASSHAPPHRPARQVCCTCRLSLSAALALCCRLTLSMRELLPAIGRCRCLFAILLYAAQQCRTAREKKASAGAVRSRQAGEPAGAARSECSFVARPLLVFHAAIFLRSACLRDDSRCRAQVKEIAAGDCLSQRRARRHAPARLYARRMADSAQWYGAMQRCRAIVRLILACREAAAHGVMRARQRCREQRAAQARKCRRREMAPRYADLHTPRYSMPISREAFLHSPELASDIKRHGR